MSSPKNVRAREQEKRLQALEAREAAMRAYRRKQAAFGVGGVVVLVAILVAIVIAGVKSRDSGPEVASGQASTTTSSSVTEPEQPPTNTAPPIEVAEAAPGKRMVGDTPCPKLDGSEERYTSFEKPPPMCMDPRQKYDVTITTTTGDIKAQIANPQAADVVNNFITLAAYHYYDDMPIDFVMERGWWEAGGHVDEPDGQTSPGYTVPFTGPDQLMPSIAIGMRADAGAVGGRLIVGFGEMTSALPKGTPFLGLVLDGTQPSLDIGKTGTASGAVTALNKILRISITLGDLAEETPGSTEAPGTTVTTAAPADTSTTEAAPLP